MNNASFASLRQIVVQHRAFGALHLCVAALARIAYQQRACAGQTRALRLITCAARISVTRCAHHQASNQANIASTHHARQCLREHIMNARIAADAHHRRVCARRALCGIISSIRFHRRAARRHRFAHGILRASFAVARKTSRLLRTLLHARSLATALNIVRVVAARLGCDPLLLRASCVARCAPALHRAARTHCAARRRHFVHARGRIVCTRALSAHAFSTSFCASLRFVCCARLMLFAVSRAHLHSYRIRRA